MNYLKSKSLYYCLLFLLVLPTVIWIFLDQHIWPWDPAWYGQVSVDLFYSLTQDINQWPKAMLLAVGAKAPGIAWIGQFFVPLSSIVGSVDRSLLLSLIVAQVIILYLMYKIILWLTDQNNTIATIGMVIAASMTLFIAMGRHYFVEMWQLLVVVAFMFIATRINTWKFYTTVLVVICMATFAVLVKITSPLYVFFPVLLILNSLFKLKNRELLKEYFSKRRNVFYYLLGLVLVLMVASWYVVNWDTMWEHARQASSGYFAEFYGTKGAFLTKLAIWLIYFKESFFLPWTLYFVVLLILTCLVKIIFSGKKTTMKRESRNMVIASVLSITLVLITFSFQINEETRYLLPLVPYVVIILCWLVYKLNTKWVNLLVVGVFISQWVFINLATFGFIETSPGTMSLWATTIEVSRLKKETIDLVLAQTCKAENTNQTNIVGVEIPWFNANSIQYYAAQRKLSLGYSCYYTSLGYLETNVEKAWHRMKQQIQPPYFITFTKSLLPSAGALNAVSVAIGDLIEKDKSFVELPITSTNLVKIFKNLN